MNYDGISLNVIDVTQCFKLICQQNKQSEAQQQQKQHTILTSKMRELKNYIFDDANWDARKVRDWESKNIFNLIFFFCFCFALLSHH